MFKENGRLNISVVGTISGINKETEMPYIVVDGEKVYIKYSSASLINEIKDGDYIKLKCYLDEGKLFATSVK